MRPVIVFRFLEGKSLSVVLDLYDMLRICREATHSDRSLAGLTLADTVIDRVLRKHLHRERRNEEVLVTQVIHDIERLAEAFLFHIQIIPYGFKLAPCCYAVFLLQQVYTAPKKSGKVVYCGFCAIRLVEIRAYRSEAVVDEMRLYLRHKELGSVLFELNKAFVEFFLCFAVIDRREEEIINKYVQSDDRLGMILKEIILFTYHGNDRR